MGIICRWENAKPACVDSAAKHCAASRAPARPLRRLPNQLLIPNFRIRCALATRSVISKEAPRGTVPYLRPWRRLRNLLADARSRSSIRGPTVRFHSIRCTSNSGNQYYGIMARSRRQVWIPGVALPQVPHLAIFSVRRNAFDGRHDHSGLAQSRICVSPLRLHRSPWTCSRSKRTPRSRRTRRSLCPPSRSIRKRVSIPAPGS
jgi:hypothetical protein